MGRGQEEQEAIWEVMCKTGTPVQVDAVAGSGKSYTVKEAVRRIGDKRQQTILAFNKPVADETKLDLDRMGLRNATSSTIHSVGLRMVMSHFGRRPKVGTTRFDLVRRQAYLQRYDWGATNRVLSHAKNCLIGPREVTPSLVESLAARAGFKYTNPDKVAKVVNTMLEIALDGSKLDEITFDDMIYIPAMLGLKRSGPGIIYVDEAQDLNAAQHKIVSDCFDGARVNAVGDPFQSIYRWRNAAEDSMEILRQRLNQTVMPITVTRRCPHSVVATANTLVPHLRAMETAIDGLVDLAEEIPLESYEGSTLVVCRRNAPLLGACLRLIRAGVPAFLNDGDFSETLTNLYSTIMSKTQPTTRDDATRALFEYQRGFIMQAEERYEDPEDRLDAVKSMEDRIEAIAAVLDLVDSPGAVPAKIEQLFSRGSGGVCFSSIHRAKGLEADRVFILEPAALKVDTQEQVNLAYVAMTRAKKELYFVGGMPEWL